VTAERRGWRIILPVAARPPMGEGCMSTIKQPAWRLRAVVDADFDGVVAVTEARMGKLKTATRMTQEGWKEWWTELEARRATDWRVAVDPAGRIIGTASVDSATPPFITNYGWASVHPDHWACEELWDALLSWAIARAEADVELAPAEAQVSLLSEALDVDLWRKAALGRAGFGLARIFFRMQMDLDREPAEPRVPAGVVVRKMDMERELRDVAVVHDEAFRDHWGHIAGEIDSFVEEWQKDTRGHRADLSYVAVAEGILVGYALCEDNFHTDPSVGRVAYLGILPAYRRRGIALALLQTALRGFKVEGFRAARLGVDASSPTGATHLYEKAGMRAYEQVNRYKKILRPGVDWLNRPGS
jgi:ribosomal protein S18 acetylase RimI-like enzyme